MGALYQEGNKDSFKNTGNEAMLKRIDSGQLQTELRTTGQSISSKNHPE